MRDSVGESDGSDDSRLIESVGVTTGLNGTNKEGTVGVVG
jgi:hypothetical protein